MVTSPHEVAHRIFQERPDILVPAFRILGVTLAEKVAVDVLTPDATEIRPLERRVDSVLRVTPSEGDAFLLAIEAQSRRAKAKPSSWTYYLAHLQEKYGSPALLLVVCQDKATAEWAAGPFTTGIEGWTALTTRPLVLGPGNVPVITDPDEAAQDLTLATFCAMTHGRDRDNKVILEALARALGSATSDSARYYAELLEIGLGDSPARATWRDLMTAGTYFPGSGTLFEETYLEGMAKGMAEGEAKGKAEGEAKGKAEGEAQSIVRVLQRRGIPLSPEAEQTILECNDLDTLDRWLDRALTATQAEDLFAAE